MVEKFLIEKLVVEKSWVGNLFLTLGLSSLRLKSSWLKYPGLRDSYLKSLGLKNSWLKSQGLKLGVEKSRLEMSFNRFWSAVVFVIVRYLWMKFKNLAFKFW